MKPQRKEKSAFEAKVDAQRLACAPFEFQAAVAMRDLGLLEALDSCGDKGAAEEDLRAAAGLSEYGARVLLEAARSAGLIEQEDGRWRLTKTGWFLQNDELTRANFDFAADVCYTGLSRLGDSLRSGRPEGLAALGLHSKTVYPGLGALPEPARSSWFRYDHFFSDAAFQDALPHVLKRHPGLLYDVGGNTGIWSILCCRSDPQLRCVVIDLPQQCRMVRENAARAGLSGRIGTFEADLLASPGLPGEADLWWMSQFLDCFSAEEACRILRSIARSMKKEARILVLEPLLDHQPFEAGRRCLADYSLYFTAIANGTSRFYSQEELQAIASGAGLELESVVQGLGLGHTLLTFRKSGGRS
ncbi:SAM-dependent methyltransferase [Mesosutterella sp. OilRF-GAM-744-9]|uniref:SAM-dependent methyltransferase n=1 Tax=Mesosutterella porci TaxID=2915351 RepID=A0ABS9MQW2_9BURK|nr:methyltransferase [Mesosutterella sp. oilRF-744-WT-GAM-9]MCG5031018.1 SAM-dependent methyltransferase [Mesosutterella sp. oilRF-744-WT-GAM-9]